MNEQSVGDIVSMRLVPKGIQNQDVITAIKLTRRTIINKLYTSIINNSAVKFKLIASYCYNYNNYRNRMNERTPHAVIFCKNHTRSSCNGIFIMHKCEWTNNDYSFIDLCMFTYFMYIYCVFWSVQYICRLVNSKLCATYKIIY